MRTTLVHTITTKIKGRGPGHLWSVGDFPNYSAHTVARTLSRLSLKGFLVKVRPGTYYFGKNTPLGKTMPQPIEIIEKLHDRKFTGGLHAFYNLGLTRQVPVTLTLVSASRRSIQKTKTIRRNIAHLKGASDQEFWILEALRKIKSIPDCPPPLAISKLIAYVDRNQMSIKRLVKFALSEPAHVRALLGAIGTDLGAPERELIRLKKSLNRLTQFKIKVEASLKSAKEWNII